VSDALIDRFAIHDLWARYRHTIDSQYSGGWAQCFTAEGIFEFDGWAIRGREALTQSDRSTRSLFSWGTFPTCHR
jgi:hypothetical protein